MSRLYTAINRIDRMDREAAIYDIEKRLKKLNDARSADKRAMLPDEDYAAIMKTINAMNGEQCAEEMRVGSTKDFSANKPLDLKK
jgi:hypothetical protein